MPQQPPKTPFKKSALALMTRAVRALYSNSTLNNAPLLDLIRVTGRKTTRRLFAVSIVFQHRFSV